jgi:Transposase IS66 family
LIKLGRNSQAFRSVIRAWRVVKQGQFEAATRIRLASCSREFIEVLLEPEVSPTNNDAERALRSGVVVRKLSAGSKNEAGPMAFSGFKSVIETGKLSGRSGLKTLLDLYTR